MTDDKDFTLDPFLKSFSYLRFRTTLDKLFSTEFISLFANDTLKHPFKILLLKSIEPYSQLTDMTVTIDSQGQMLLTLSRSLDQSTGLDASVPLIDSAVFDSSTRLLQFNLPELLTQKKKLERIQRNSAAVLDRLEYSCEFVAVIDSKVNSSFINNSLSKLFGSPVSIDTSLNPKLTAIPSKSVYWPINEKINLSDRLEVLDRFDWIGQVLNPNFPQNFASDETELIDNFTFFSLEGPILFPLTDLIPQLLSSSTRLLVSLKACQKIPPSYNLNSHRLKHFNEKKFDPTACTADQSGLVIFKSAHQTITFTLNSTA